MIARRALIVGLLGLACASACSRDVSSQHATARAPVRAKVQVAPVVDDHPWVIAFLTEISITRPPGADARLEGRTGLEGLRHPEPIIEAETREALERALAAYAGKFSKDARLEPVFEADPFGPDARVRWRLHFVDRSRGFVLDEQAEAAIVEHDHGPSVHLYLSETQRAQLQTLSMDVAGGRLAVAIDDEALMVPIVMDPISNGEIQVLTRLREDQAQVSSQLFTRLTEQPAGG